MSNPTLSGGRPEHAPTNGNAPIPAKDGGVKRISTQPDSNSIFPRYALANIVYVGSES
jgi:hypothetical protein